MTLTVNGQRRTIAAGVMLAGFIQAELASSKGVAVAVDSQVVPRAEWPDFELLDGHRLEILSAVQGG